MLKSCFYIYLIITYWLTVMFQCQEIQTSKPNRENSPNSYEKGNSVPEFKRHTWENCQNISSKEPEKISKIFNGKYLVKSCEICRTKEELLKLMIFIISAPENIYQRNTIRMTWGHYSLRRDVAISFVIAIENWENKNLNHSNIQAEISSYNDIIIPKYKDGYDKLTLKTVFLLDWTLSCCLNTNDLYILKCDDDMIINVPFVLDVIKDIKAGDKLERKIYGDIHPLNYPYRDGNEKYSVDCDQYQYLMYPNFTSGPAYFFSQSLVRPLFRTALRTPFLKLEDVFLTGIVAETLGIPRVHLESFVNEVNNNFVNNCKINEVATLMVEPLSEDQFVAWSQCNILL